MDSPRRRSVRCGDPCPLTTGFGCDVRKKACEEVTHDLIYNWWNSVEFCTIVNTHVMPWKECMDIAFFQLLSRQVAIRLRFLEGAQLRHSWVPSQTRGSSGFALSCFPVSASTCCCSLGCGLAFAAVACGPFSKPAHRTRPWCSGWGG